MPAWTKTGRSLKYTLLGVLAASFATAAEAADIYPYMGSIYSGVVIEGEIQKGDYDEFIDLLQSGQGRFDGVILMSAGGDFDEAIKIGRALRALELSSLVPSYNERGKPSCIFLKPKNESNCTCLSACFFIHVGAVSRSGLYLGVHRPYYDPAGFRTLSRAEAQDAFTRLQETASQYFSEMEVPKQVQEVLFNTPSDEIHLLDKATVKTHFLGLIPYLDEWYRSRCTLLSNEQEVIFEDLSNKARLNALSKEENAIWESLYELSRQERECAIKEGSLAKIKAFQDFFNESPDDITHHDFTIWSEASELLGMQADALKMKGFSKVEFGFGSLKFEKPATTSEPMISVSDYGMPQSGKVGILHVSSHDNPSKDFSENVLTALIAAWGQPSSSEGDKFWRWEKPEFRATLSVDTSGRASAVSQHWLSLAIEDWARWR